ncbi:conserved hypothetical protein, partial [Ricinus communis]
LRAAALRPLRRRLIHHRLGGRGARTTQAHDLLLGSADHAGLVVELKQLGADREEAAGHAGVDPFAQAHQIDADSLQFAHDLQQVDDVSREGVQAGNHQQVAGLGRGDGRLQPRLVHGQGVAGVVMQRLAASGRQLVRQGSVEGRAPNGRDPEVADHPHGACVANSAPPGKRRRRQSRG